MVERIGAASPIIFDVEGEVVWIRRDMRCMASQFLSLNAPEWETNLSKKKDYVYPNMKNKQGRFQSSFQFLTAPGARGTNAAVYENKVEVKYDKYGEMRTDRKVSEFKVKFVNQSFPSGIMLLKVKTHDGSIHTINGIPSMLVNNFHEGLNVGGMI